jgi:cyclomaltodextrinase / maltogenic alpha-amylase / neopullulanase
MMDTLFFHNSHEEKYRFPFGAVPCGSRVSLSLSVQTSSPISSADLIISRPGDSDQRLGLNLIGRSGEALNYTVLVDVPQEPGLLWYYFELVMEGKKYYYGNSENSLGGIGRIYGAIPPGYQITVYKGEAETPHWYKKSIMYQIFVDRFYNGSKEFKVLNPKKNSFIYANWEDTPTYIKNCENGSIARWDFFGGNLQGVIDKLSYLRELGISVIYLNPVFEAPSNHKYDTADYKNIDPMFGSNEIFKDLCKKAEQLGIAIILDGVFSHTGSDSIYFNRYGSYPGVGAFQSTESPYYSWYRFKCSRDDYECWWGVESLPNVNEMDPGYIDYIATGQNSVIKQWMDLGAKGWRLDVADELPDEFIHILRKTMKEKDSNSVLMGEVWEDASNKESYGKRRAYLLGEELDSVMNYPFREIMIDFFTGRHDARHANEVLMSIYENYPPHNFYSNMNLIGTHDVPRILTILGDAPGEQQLSQMQKEAYRLPESQRSLGIARLKLLSLIQMTFPGVPSIYYGDEAGLEGYKDPLNRGTYPWGNENSELLDWYKSITSIRSKYDVFSTGKWIPVYAEGDVYGYVRRAENRRDVFGEQCEDNTALVLVNRSRDSQHRVSLDMRKWGMSIMYDLLGSGKRVEIIEGRLDIILEPLQGKLYLEKL